MSLQEKIENTILEYPVCEYHFGSTEEIIFSDKTWYVCEHDCDRYGHSWACPPYCGDLHERIAMCKKYQKYCLFSTVVETENAWDKQETLRLKKVHEDLTRQIRDQLGEYRERMYFISAGCSICDVCACPDEPCRHPEDRLSSMESYGILVLQLAEEIGVTSSFGMDSVVYFSMILFNE